MPTTRKKVIKTVYKDEDDSEADPGDFSDSGSDAVISQPSSSEDDEEPEVHNTSEDDEKTSKKSRFKPIRQPRHKKIVHVKVNQQTNSNKEKEKEKFDSEPKVEPIFSVKDLTDADKLLPSFLNLSESDSSDDEEPIKPSKLVPGITTHTNVDTEENELESSMEYQDVWSNNLEQSEEIARKTFQELEKHKSKLEETKQSIQNYTTKKEKTRESDVNDLLALGEEVLPPVSPTKIKKRKPTKARNKSDSEMEDWEEVAETTAVPQQGLQLVVDFPGAVCRKTKKLDVEMMMKRKINRVKKEYQVYMHKVHVLCWLGHGNYVSQVLNDQEVMAAALPLMPSKECYPGERVDIKYVEQITTWFKDKITIKFDKNEGKFRPKAPPLKQLLLEQIKNRAVTSKKYVVYIFISMLRAVGLQCRIMLNFTTLPIKPPSTELCSLSTKPKINENKKQKDGAPIKESKKKVAKDSCDKIPQLDGNYDSTNDSDFDNIMQIDGNDDSSSSQVKTPVKGKSKIENNNVDDVSPPKRPRRNLSVKKGISDSKMITSINNNKATGSKENMKLDDKTDLVHRRVTKKSLSLNRSNTKNKDNISDNKSTYDTNKTPVKNLSLHRETKSSNYTKNKDNISDSSSKDENIRRTPVKSLFLCRERKQSNTNNKDNIGDSKSKDDNIDSTPAKSPLGKERKPPSTKNKDNICDKPKAENIRNTKPVKHLSLRKRNITKKDEKPFEEHKVNTEQKSPSKIIISETIAKVSSEYFDNGEPSESKRDARARKRSHTSNPLKKQSNENNDQNIKKLRAKSVPDPVLNKSKYFEDNKTNEKVVSAAKKVTPQSRKVKQDEFQNEDSKRVSHRDLVKPKAKPKNDVTKELVNIIKNRVKEAKEEDKKVKRRKSSDDDSDYLPEETEQKPSISKKASKKTGMSRKIDLHALSTDDEAPSKKIDVWCEIYVEELEQWIAVDVIKGRVHCVNEIYSGATHPVNYVVGWDNSNYLKDLTRRYVPHWNTVTRKQRVEPSWWSEAIQPWLGPRTPRDREEDECLDRMQLDAPLPKSIVEYKNHPLYALKRHLLKFEAIYPPDAATLGFVRGEPVYARECVYVCRSRDTWLKEAKVVRLGEQPYKVVKARPKWDKLSNKIITDKPLEVFGPWQVQDYEPPTAENGIVPRNAYGNVELFKECMLPKGTVHIKLPGLNRVAKKLNIDCAPAMTGFDFNGGWSHPVYDGFVVCQEFEEVMINAWKEDQEEQERKELEKIEARVYGNWKRLIKGLLIKERLKLKYGFTEPTTSQETKKKSTGPRLTVKKKC